MKSEKRKDMPTITTTNFLFTGQSKVYHGKVRDVYTIGDLLN